MHRVIPKKRGKTVVTGYIVTHVFSGKYLELSDGFDCQILLAAFPSPKCLKAQTAAVGNLPALRLTFMQSGVVSEL